MSRRRRIVLSACSMNSGWPSSTIRIAFLFSAKFGDLVVDQRVGDVQAVNRHRGFAVNVGKAELLQRAHDRIVHAALHDDADVGGVGAEKFVEFAFLDKFDRRRPALLDFLALVQIRGRRQHDAFGIAARIFQRFAQREARLLVVLGDEAAVDVTGADTDFEHHRRVRDFGKFEAVFNRPDDGRQVRARVEQPDLRFHRERMRALLHDRGAFAVILADDDERAAGDAAGGKIGDGVGGHVDADRRLERHRAADRIMHRGGKRRRGGGFRSRVLEMHAELVEHVLGVGEHIHQMRNRRALIAADIRYAGLQQRLGDGENAFAAEFLAFAQFEILHFACKRSFRHESLQAELFNQASPADVVCYETFQLVLQRPQQRTTHAVKPPVAACAGR